jgi:hypothetical protein
MQELHPVKETTEIPSIFYTHVLNGSATLSHPIRFWLLAHMVLQQALGQLDPQRVGLILRLVRCTAPSSEGKVRSLRTSISIGTDLGRMEMLPRLLGAESLAGQALSSNCLLIREELSDYDLMVAPGQACNTAAVACPIVQAHRVAGCLLAFCSRAEFFNQDRQALIRHYANLLALAFEPGEFYDLWQLNLRIMPSWDVQARSFTAFHQRVADVLAASIRREQFVDVVQAELQVWSQFEEEFCGKS